MTKGIIPTEISIGILYFQETPKDKRMISAEGELSEYVTAKKHDGTYALEVTMEALGWFDLLNYFAFDYIFYIALFHGLGAIAVMIIVAFWFFARTFTTLRDPPRFRFFPYVRIITGAPAQGIVLSMFPFFLAQIGVRQIITSISFLSMFPISIDNYGREIDEDVVLMATNGRMALCFMTVSCYLMQCAAEILVPVVDSDEVTDEDEDNIFKPNK